MADKETAAAEKKAAANTYSFDQIITSGKYKAYRDVLSFTLDPSRQYTTEEVDGQIKAFMERKVK
jgi:hypothetical protein